MAAIKAFEEIEAWLSARELVRVVYKLTLQTKMNRDWEYVNQIRGASLSSMSNIAEGFSRRSDKDFARFLEISQGSAMEVQSLAYAGLDIGYLNENEFKAIRPQAGKTANLVGGFHAYLTKRRALSTPSAHPVDARHQTPDTRHQT